MQTNIFESVTPNILSFLRACDDALQGAMRPRTGGYSSIYDFLLKNGSGWRADPDSDPKTASGAGSFRQAGLIALLVHRWTYAEGFACRPGSFPVPHAWLVDAEGELADPSWRSTKGTEYFGVPVKPEFLGRQLLTQDYYRLLDFWGGPSPLLTSAKRIWVAGRASRALRQRFLRGGSAESDRNGPINPGSPIRR